MKMKKILFLLPCLLSAVSYFVGASEFLVKDEPTEGVEYAVEAYACTIIRGAFGIRSAVELRDVPTVVFTAPVLSTCAMAFVGEREDYGRKVSSWVCEALANLKNIKGHRNTSISISTSAKKKNKAYGKVFKRTKPTRNHDASIVAGQDVVIEWLGKVAAITDKSRSHSSINRHSICIDNNSKFPRIYPVVLKLDARVVVRESFLIKRQYRELFRSDIHMLITNMKPSRHPPVYQVVYDDEPDKQRGIKNNKGLPLQQHQPQQSPYKLELYQGILTKGDLENAVLIKNNYCGSCEDISELEFKIKKKGFFGNDGIVAYIIPHKDIKCLEHKHRMYYSHITKDADHDKTRFSLKLTENDKSKTKVKIPKFVEEALKWPPLSSGITPNMAHELFGEDDYTQPPLDDSDAPPPYTPYDNENTLVHETKTTIVKNRPQDCSSDGRLRRYSPNHYHPRDEDSSSVSNRVSPSLVRRADSPPRRRSSSSKPHPNISNNIVLTQNTRL